MYGSPAQIIANKANAQKSTGPRSQAGKDRSSRNGFIHGCCCEQVVSFADQPAFQARMERWIVEQAPKTEAELIALQASVVASFRMLNCQKKQAKHLDDRIEQGLRDLRQKWADDALAWRDHLPDPNALASIQRSSTGLRLFAHTWHELAVQWHQGHRWSGWERMQARRMLAPVPLKQFDELLAMVEGGAAPSFLIDFCLRQVRSCESLAEQIAGGPEQEQVRRVITDANVQLDHQSFLTLRYETAAERTFHRGLDKVRRGRQDRARAEKSLSVLLGGSAEGTFSALGEVLKDPSRIEGGTDGFSPLLREAARQAAACAGKSEEAGKPASVGADPLKLRPEPNSFSEGESEKAAVADSASHAEDAAEKASVGVAPPEITARTELLL